MCLEKTTQPTRPASRSTEAALIWRAAILPRTSTLVQGSPLLTRRLRRTPTTTPETAPTTTPDHSWTD